MKSIALLAALTLTTTAMAQDPIKVSFGDLDLTTKEGVSALYSRIDFAARQQCGDPEAVVQVYAKEGIAKCMKLTMAATVKAVRNVQLTQYAASVR